MKNSLQEETFEKINALELSLEKLQEQVIKDKSEISTLKSQKKEQTLKVAKQAKDNLIKQKEQDKTLKQTQASLAEVQEKFEAQKAVIEELSAQLSLQGKKVESQYSSQNTLQTQID